MNVSAMFLNRATFRALAAALLCGVTVASGIAHAEPQDAGHLVIVGGRLSPEHALIYETFLAGVTPDQRVGVVPLASGVPERSGPLTVQDIRQFTETPQRVFDAELVHTRPELAQKPATEKILAECRALWFTGGDQSRITAVMRPAAGDTVSYHAVQRVLAEGGTVGGTSAGAAMMSDPMIRSGNSADALLLGATQDIDGPGVCVGQGMGFFAYGLVDQHFLRRGRFGRLLVALEATDTMVGFGVSENRGMAVDRATGGVTTLGDQAVTMIDRRASTAQGRERQNIRVSILGAGDQIDGLTYAVTPGPDKRELSPSPTDTGVSIRFPDMWDRYVVAEMIKALAANPHQPVASSDASFEYRMTADDQTRFFLGQPGEELSAINVRLDITPNEDVEENAKRRLQTLAERAAD